jgi:hypothetical protein
MHRDGCLWVARSSDPGSDLFTRSELAEPDPGQSNIQGHAWIHAWIVDETRVQALEYRAVALACHGIGATLRNADYTNCYMKNKRSSSYVHSPS